MAAVCGPDRQQGQEAWPTRKTGRAWGAAGFLKLQGAEAV